MLLLVPSLHAVRQLVWHAQAGASLAPPAWLNEIEAGLFRRMPPADQVEGLAVARRLEGWGYGEDRDLLVAGLLHDLGKSLAPEGLRFRVLTTLIESLMPWLVWPLIRRGGTLGRLWNHPAIGADAAAAAGLPARVVALIRDHHAPARDSYMVALQLADDLH